MLTYMNKHIYIHTALFTVSFICTFSASANTPGFTTLSQAQQYADHMPEFPPESLVNLTNPLDPDYSMFHRKFEYAPLFSFIRYIPFLNQHIWQAEDLADTIEKLNDNPPYGTTEKGVCHLNLPQGSQLFIWGDLHGAFHSFVRDLTNLYHQNIIRNDLTVTSDTYYLVFNGNAINLSPYSMETLTLIASLIRNNPTHVIYLAGTHELNRYWHNFGLKRELQIRAGHLYQEYIPLAESINTFFNNLPLALYVTTENDRSKALRISHSGFYDDIIDTSKLGPLFQQENTLYIYDTQNGTPTKDPVDTLSLIRDEPWQETQRAKDGLGLLPQDKGATTWCVLSSPTYVYRTFYPFNYDAYAVVTLASSVESSTISLYNRSLEQKDSTFTQTERYNIYTAVPATSAKRKHLTESFNIGTTMGYELNLSAMSLYTTRGIMAHLNAVNQQGGIQEQSHLRMYTYNDDYQPHQAIRNINHMLNNGIETIMCPTGTPTLEGYIEKVRNNELLVLFPITGSPLFRDPELTGVIHFRGTYAQEVEALITYMIDDYNATSFAFFYQDDAYGRSALRGARNVLQNRGIENWTEVPYVRGAADFTEQAQAIKKAAPQVIGFFSAAEPAIKVIRSIGIPWLANKYMIGITFAVTQTLRNFLQTTGLSMTVGAVTPNPHISDLPIAQEYRAAMDAAELPYDNFSFESYIGTRIFADAAEHITMPITREKIRKRIESYDAYHYKGLNLTFDPETRSLSPGIWIETNKNEQWTKQK